MTPLSKSAADLLLIERYFDYDLEENETDHFFKRLETDPVFEQQVARFRAVQEESLQLFQVTTITIKKPGKAVIFKRQKWWIGLVAGISILILLIPIVDKARDLPLAIAMAEEQVKTFNADELNFNISPEIPHLLTKEEITKKEILVSYKKQDYVQALEKINHLPLTTDLQLIQALSFEELGQLDKAKEGYLQVIAAKHEQLNIARWGLVEVCLKQRDCATAKKNLRYLAAQECNPTFSYRTSCQKATDILNLLYLGTKKNNIERTLL